MSMSNSDVTASTGGGVSNWLNRNPTIALGGVLVIVLLVGGVLLKKKTTATATSAGTAQDLSGLSTNSNGNPIVYIPTQTAFTTYNATDASQSVSNTGNGNVNTGSSSAGNSSTTTGASHPGPIKKPPVPGPAKVSLQWNQHIITANQTINRIADNVNTALIADGRKFGSTQKYHITGQQIYNQNKGAVDMFFNAHKLGKANVNKGTTGLALTIPQLVKG
jgi:hypothetical protein